MRLLKRAPIGRAGSPLTGGTLVGGSSLRRPPYIKCERPVPAGPLLGGPGGTTCPAAPGIFFSLYSPCEKKGSPPRRGSFLVPADKAGVRRAPFGSDFGELSRAEPQGRRQSSRVRMIVSRPTLPPRPSASDGRGPGPKTLDIGLSASRSLPTARTQNHSRRIRSLHSATKTRFVQDQFPRNPESDVADLTHRNEAGSCDSLAVAVTGLRSQGASAHSRGPRTTTPTPRHCSNSRRI